MHYAKAKGIRDSCGRPGWLARALFLDDRATQRHAAHDGARAALVLRGTREFVFLVIALDVDDGVAAFGKGPLLERNHGREERPLAAFLVGLVGEIGLLVRRERAQVLLAGWRPAEDELHIGAQLF